MQLGDYTMVKLKTIFQVGQMVKYKGKETIIRHFCGEGICNIDNPDFDMLLNHNVCHRLTVLISDLTPI